MTPAKPTPAFQPDAVYAPDGYFIGNFPDRQDPFGDRYGKWGSSPARNAPLPGLDHSDTFGNRFGNWGSVPAGRFGDTGSAALRELQRRSAAPDGSPSTSAQGAVPATPASRHPAAYSPAGDFFGKIPRTPAIAATPSPSIASQPNLVYFPGSNSSPVLDADGSPPPAAGENFRRLGRRTYSQSPASVFDTGAPAVPFVPSDDADFSGGLPGKLAAILAGMNQTQAAPPSPDEEQEQADIRSLDARLSRSGNIKDAVALYNARKSNWR